MTKRNHIETSAGPAEKQTKSEFIMGSNNDESQKIFQSKLFVMQVYNIYYIIFMWFRIINKLFR